MAGSCNRQSEQRDDIRLLDMIYKLLCKHPETKQTNVSEAGARVDDGINYHCDIQFEVDQQAINTSNIFTNKLVF